MVSHTIPGCHPHAKELATELVGEGTATLQRATLDTLHQSVKQRFTRCIPRQSLGTSASSFPRKRESSEFAKFASLARWISAFAGMTAIANFAPSRRCVTSLLYFARKGAMAQSIRTSVDIREFNLPIKARRFLNAALVALLLLAPTAQAENHPAYTLQAIPTPEDVPFEASAVETLPDGRVAVALRKGEVWLLDGLDTSDPAKFTFKKIAEALHEPLDLLYRDDGLYVVQRGELTHLRDTNDDDIIDEYRTVTSAWGITGNYHEYAYGAVPARDGSLWVTLNIGMGKADYPDQDAWRGWGVKVFPDGRLEPQCAGMRSPCGLGANLAGDVFFTDQQGNWIPAGSLHLLRQGAFYGHVESLKHCALPGSPVEKPERIPSGIPLPQAKAAFPLLSLPAVWFPYKKVGMSATDILCVQNDQQIGPFKGQLLVGDFTTAAISRVFLEQVNGEYQGACFNFLDTFQSAVLRMAWAKDGSLLVGESNRGWNSVGQKSFGLDRVTWNGDVPFEIQEMRLESDGFTLRFTRPADKTSAAHPVSYTLASYTLMYHSAYGSPEIDPQPHAIHAATVTDDGLEVRLVTDPIRQYHIHELQADGVKDTEGRPLAHADAYYTANQLVGR